jgi:hypothetical protein
LIYHGGTVQTVPAIFVVYWGTEWERGFTATHGASTYTSATIQNSIDSFFTNVGSESLGGGTNAILSRDHRPSVFVYRPVRGAADHQPARSVERCLDGPGACTTRHRRDPLVGNFTTDPPEAKAIRAAQHFGYDANATYTIFTPPNHGATGYGSVYCAYHHETTHTSNPGVRYAFIPYVPERGTGCGGNRVNAQDDAFGHGYLDGYSIVAGHEYAEAVTDPGNLTGFQDGWNDATTSENGDKCAWSGLQNVTLAGQSYAVQPLWSNEANGGQGACVMSR